ncbi:MAG: hypothetical protein OHK0029_29250 [Armatimonadaceae bacterium]
MLPKQERLTRNRDFQAVYSRKRNWVHPLLVLYVRNYGSETDTGETRRFGFSVSKKVGKAHDRNRVKRRLREICRAQNDRWRTGFDVVVVARPASVNASFAELQAAILDVATKAKLLSAKPVHLASAESVSETGVRKEATSGAGTAETKSGERELQPDGT